MANIQQCKRCGCDIRPSEHAKNQRFCTKDCRDTWWNEARSTRARQEDVAGKRLGSGSPSFSLTDVQAAWLAALLDGEGSIGIWRERRKRNTSGFRYVSAVQISNTNWEILDRVRALVDGFAFVDPSARKRNPKNKPLYRVTINRRAVLRLLEQVRPYLVIKGRQADVVMQMRRLLADAPMRMVQEHELFEQLYQEAKALNKRGV